jgi:hypothetical protein
MKEELIQRRSRVNLDIISDVHYWKKKFNCTKKQLRDATSVIGYCPEEVKLYLKAAKRPIVNILFG